MIYEQKLPRSHKTKSEQFYLAEELGYLKKKYHGKIPYHVYSREASKYGFHIRQKIHTKGQLVEYRGKLAVVYKVEPNGVYLLKLKKGEAEEFEKEPIFVKENTYQEHTYPVLKFPFYSIVGALAFMEGINYKKRTEQIRKHPIKFKEIQIYKK